MQKLLTRRLTNTPTNTSQVRGNCGLSLNRDQSLGAADLKTVNNNPEENQSQLTGSFKSKVLVFVISKEGKPLMPCKPAKAKKLLKAGKAKVIRRTPFTIQLNFECENKVQDIILGVDTGYKHIGVSAVSEDKELFPAEVELRTDIPKKLSEKRQYRSTRRNKLWYRKARFLNRGNKSKGWLAPSVEHRLDSHIKIVNFIKSILPITQINIEAAAFDIQKINNPEISGVEYQGGVQKDFWNVRGYVLYRDNHTCWHCGKSKDTILNVHHIESRQTGGDRPDNLITLCNTCHDGYHKGKIELKLKKSKGFKTETIMSILRWKIVDRLRELGNTVNITYGYLTKSARIALKLEKTHNNDAFCIASGTIQERTAVYTGKQTRRNNRAIQLNRKGFKPSVRKQRYKFQPMDLIRIAKKVCFVSGIQNLGKYIKLKELKKPVKTESVQLIKYGKGLQFIPAL
ncbi:MAG: RNA-guided endonuclease IscB [bacterium]